MRHCFLMRSLYTSLLCSVLFCQKAGSSDIRIERQAVGCRVVHNGATRIANVPVRVARRARMPAAAAQFSQPVETPATLLFCAHAESARPVHAESRPPLLFARILPAAVLRLRLRLNVGQPATASGERERAESRKADMYVRGR